MALYGMMIISLMLSSCVNHEAHKALIDLWDAEQLAERVPLLIAHRGGVSGSGVPECSELALRLAADVGYDMLELDVQESKDHHPVVFHDSNMKEACGIDHKISDFTLEELEAIKFRDSDETIKSLDTMLHLCSLLKLGVMFDIKQGELSEIYFERIRELIDQYGLERSCMTIGDSQVQEELKGKALLTIRDEMLEELKKGERPDLHGFFWFGVPKKWPLELVPVVQENGGLVIPALNVFRYSEENHRAEASYDAERLLEAGVDGFQIDCAYQDYFGLPEISE